MWQTIHLPFLVSFLSIFLVRATAASVGRQAMFLFRKYDHGLGAWKGGKTHGISHGYDRLNIIPD